MDVLRALAPARRPAAAFVAAAFLVLSGVQLYWARGGARGGARGTGAAWGGQDGALPPALRAASAVVAALLLGAAAAFATAARRAPPERRWVRLVMWAVTAVLALSALANAASPIAAERTVNAPIAALGTAASAVVALTSRPPR